jgi:hypothetical protein
VFNLLVKYGAWGDGRDSNAPHGLTKAEGDRMALDDEHKDLQLATGRQ